LYKRYHSFQNLSAWQESPGFFRVHNPLAYSTVGKVIDMPGVDDIAADNDNGDDNDDDSEDNDNSSNNANWL